MILKLKKLYLSILSAAIMFAIASSVYAHPGRLDSNGGHYDRSTGEYHYHDGGSSGSSGGSSSDSEDYTYSVFLGPTDNYSSGSSSSSSSGSGNSSYSTGKTTTEATTNADIEETQTNNEPDYFTNTIIGIFVFLLTVLLLFKSKKLYVIYKSKKLAKKLKNEIKNIKNQEMRLEQKIAYQLRKSFFTIKNRECDIDKKYNQIQEIFPKVYYEYLYKKSSIESLCGFPEGIKDFSGLLIDTEFTDEPYGRFTVYSSPGDKTLHIEKGCGGAILTHHFLYSNLPEYEYCSVCRSFHRSQYYENKMLFIKNHNEWYEKYLSFREKYENYGIDVCVSNKIDRYSINGIRFERLAGFPEGIFISGRITNDTKSKEAYGRLTAYISDKDKTIHLIKGCCKSNIPINMVFAADEMRFYNLCERCGYTEKRLLYFNAEKWYRRYKKIKAYYTEILNTDISETKSSEEFPINFETLNIQEAHCKTIRDEATKKFYSEQFAKPEKFINLIKANTEHKFILFKILDAIFYKIDNTPQVIKTLIYIFFIILMFAFFIFALYLLFIFFHWMIYRN